MKPLALFQLTCVLLIVAGACADGASIDERLDAVRASLDGGKYKEAAAGARTVLRGARDEKTKSDATRILAVALRKDGLWRPAAKAYEDLQACCDEGSGPYVRSGATAEILEASPKGIYEPLAKQAGRTPGETGVGALADDDVLNAALAVLGTQRAEKLKGRVAQMKKARLAKDVAAIFARIAKGYREARILNPNLPADGAQNAAKAAALNLERVERDVMTPVRETLDGISKNVASRRTLTSAEQKQVAECEQFCVEAAEAEEAFRTNLKVAAGERWPEALALGAASLRRGLQYGRMVRECRRLQYIATHGLWHRGI
ncbi:MAG TPA: hypothetical protein VM238_12315 [Phycisphaerae bacterium]|nr:hypothetical protein [Phycisphaerae bacterium]